MLDSTLVNSQAKKNDYPITYNVDTTDTITGLDLNQTRDLCLIPQSSLKCLLVRPLTNDRVL